jgi:hypothetical protein
VNENSDHLQLLAIFHYVVAGWAALLSFFPLSIPLSAGSYPTPHGIRIRVITNRGLLKALFGVRPTTG